MVSILVCVNGYKLPLRRREEERGRKVSGEEKSGGESNAGDGGGVMGGRKEGDVGVE